VVIFRRALLGLGAIALLTGIAFSVLWLREPAAAVTELPAITAQSVLTAARALPTGTLLRADDLRWVQLATAEIPPGSLARGPATETGMLGAATRRDFRSGEVLIEDQLIKPSDPGFLPAVLAPGTRATSIPVNPAEGGAGLITAGDRVDVILTQTFDDKVSRSQRSVGETILTNLRVIAIDQTTSLPAKVADLHPTVTLEPRLPKTVTLEVTAHQAEMLMVANELGKLELTLRSLADATRPASLAPIDSTWASEVSPALLSLAYGRTPPPSLERGRVPNTSSPVAIAIIRGSKSDITCYSSSGGSPTNCTLTPETAAPVPPSANPGEPNSVRPK
jgi:pilus assembly protein CpaB